MSTRHRVASFSDLVEGEGLQVEVNGLLVGLFRRGETVFALGDACPHMGAPLSDGYIDEKSVVCPWHGWVFDLKTGESPIDEDARVPVFRAVVENGDVFVEIDAAACAPEDAGTSPPCDAGAGNGK